MPSRGRVVGEKTDSHFATLLATGCYLGYHIFPSYLSMANDKYDNDNVVAQWLRR